MNPDISPRRWRKARVAALVRDRWACVQCGRMGDIQVDHIRPTAFGGEPYALSNLQTLCTRHHLAKTRSEVCKPDPEGDAFYDRIVDLLESDRMG